MRSIIASLTPASGRQDHTTSSYATGDARLAHRRVHRIPLPMFVTIAKRPLVERDGAEMPLICGGWEAQYFSVRGLDRPNHVEISFEIGFYEQVSDACTQCLIPIFSRLQDPIGGAALYLGTKEGEDLFYMAKVATERNRTMPQKSVDNSRA